MLQCPFSRHQIERGRRCEGEESFRCRKEKFRLRGRTKCPKSCSPAGKRGGAREEGGRSNSYPKEKRADPWVRNASVYFLFESPSEKGKRRRRACDREGGSYSASEERERDRATKSALRLPRRKGAPRATCGAAEEEGRTSIAIYEAKVRRLRRRFTGVGQRILRRARCRWAKKEKPIGCPAPPEERRKRSSGVDIAEREEEVRIRRTRIILPSPPPSPQKRGKKIMIGKEEPNLLAIFALEGGDEKVTSDKVWSSAGEKVAREKGSAPPKRKEGRLSYELPNAPIHSFSFLGGRGGAAEARLEGEGHPRRQKKHFRTGLPDVSPEEKKRRPTHREGEKGRSLR